MSWRRGGKWWIESDTHTVAKIIVTERGNVGETKIPRVFYEVWRKPVEPGARAVRLEGRHARSDVAKAAADLDARGAT